MSRLIPGWIETIEQELADYNRSLQERTELDLTGLAAYACGLDGAQLQQTLAGKKAAVIPVTAGLGVIETFPQSLAAILRAMGLDAFVTEATDVSGFYEAHTSGAEIVLLADDDRYLALHLPTGAVADNNEATAAGYAAALDRMAGGLRGKEALLLGFGIIGRLALAELQRRGAEVSVLERDPERMRQALELGAKPCEPHSLAEHDYIFDATNEGGWVGPQTLRESAYISAPGVPLSLDTEAQERHRERLVHDPLQLGTAVMVAMLFQK